MSSFTPYKHVHCVVSQGYRHESYITHSFTASESKYHCKLCNETTVDDDSMRIHCLNDASHVNCVLAIRKLKQNSIVCQCAVLQNRIDQLGLPAWQFKVQAKLYWIFLNQDVYSPEEVEKHMSDAKELLTKYEEMEQISLLEMSLWKELCLSQPHEQDGVGGRSNDYLAWQEWVRVGWKGRKSEMRHAKEISVVITLVLPFLYNRSSGTITEMNTAVM